MKPIIRSTVHKTVLLSLLAALSGATYIGCTSTLPVCAQLSNFKPLMERAMKSYQKNDFKDAMYACKLAMQEQDCNGTAYYMYALCLHRMGRLNEAKEAYLKTMQNFPDSEASEQAQAGIVALTGHVPTSASDKPSANPRRLTLAFRVEGKNRMVQVDVNGKRVNMNFDEDAKAMTVTQETFDTLGLKKDEGGKVSTSVTAGLLSRANVPITIGASNALSARVFFDGYNYKIDDGQTVINASRMSKVDVGNELYKKGKLDAALASFTEAVRSNPNDSEAAYSRAICLHKLGKIVDAKNQYYKILDKFPKTDAFYMSQTALNQIDPAGLDSWRKGKIGASVASGANLKGMDKVKQNSEIFEVPFTWEDTNICVIANVDGYRTNMYVEPTGTMTYFSSEQLKQIDPAYLSELNQDKEGTNTAGAQSTFRAGTVKLDRLQLGRIERRKFQVAVVDNVSTAFPWRTWGKTARPVLAKGFWRGWDMDIDQIRKMILFKKKEGPTAIE